jgi:hypothetical protein
MSSNYVHPMSWFFFLFFCLFVCSTLFPFSSFTLKNVLLKSLASGLFGVTRAFSCLIFNSITLSIFLVGNMTNAVLWGCWWWKPRVAKVIGVPPSWRGKKKKAFDSSREIYLFSDILNNFIWHVMILTWFCILKLSYKFMVSVPVGVKQFDSD